MVIKLPSSLETISLDLREKYRVDEFFYPDISMSVQIPEGLKGEVFEITRILKKNRFEGESLNVYQVMQLKKKLLTEYMESSRRRKVIEAYQELLGKKIKPVGSTIPIEMILVNGLVVILLSMVARFGLSFMDEAGKIAARRLLNEEKKQARKHNMAIEEYRFLKGEALVWINKGTALKSFAMKLQTDKTPERTKKRRNKEKSD
jgi:hypothetical protein